MSSLNKERRENQQLKKKTYQTILYSQRRCRHFVIMNLPFNAIEGKTLDIHKLFFLQLILIFVQAFCTEMLLAYANTLFFSSWTCYNMAPRPWQNVSISSMSNRQKCGQPNNGVDVRAFFKKLKDSSHSLAHNGLINYFF